MTHFTPFRSDSDILLAALRFVRKGGFTMFRHFQQAMFLLVIALLSMGPRSVRAQVSTADIVGTVTDQAGAVIANAAVTVENQDTRDRRTTNTSDAGEFFFNLLQPGRYTV